MIVKKKYIVGMTSESRVVDLINDKEYFVYSITNDTGRLLSLHYVNVRTHTDVLLVINSGILGVSLVVNGIGCSFNEISDKHLILDETTYKELRPIRCMTQNINTVLRVVLNDPAYNILDTFHTNRKGCKFYLEEAEQYKNSFRSYRKDCKLC